MMKRLCVWVKVQICIWPSWCHCHSLSLAPVNPDWFYLPRFIFPKFWCRLTQVVPDKNHEGCNTVVRLCVCEFACSCVGVGGQLLVFSTSVCMCHTWIIMWFKLLFIRVLHMPVKNSSNKWRYQCNTSFSTCNCLLTNTDAADTRRFAGYCYSLAEWLKKLSGEVLAWLSV